MELDTYAKNFIFGPFEEKFFVTAVSKAFERFNIRHVQIPNGFIFTADNNGEVVYTIRITIIVDEYNIYRDLYDAEGIQVVIMNANKKIELDETIVGRWDLESFTGLLTGELRR